MLSILIPTYDYTCYKLVYDLHEQAEGLGIPYEIIVAEDGSHSPVNIIANHKIIDLTNCRHIQRKENVGRSAIRNVLIREAKGDMLLFMDSDGKVVRDDFLKKYVEAAKEHDVVCGGMKTPDVNYDPNKMLRWKYEKQYEKKHGYVSKEFRSFCFLVTRKVVERVKFDERYSQYGYEDVQFGLDLKANGFEVYPIDNPLENADIEINKDFIKKTETAMRSAYKFKSEIGDNVVVANTYEKVKHLAWLIKLFFIMFKKPITNNLMSKNPSLFLFNVYKLGYYSTLRSVVAFVFMLCFATTMLAQSRPQYSKMSTLVRQAVRSESRQHKAKGLKTNQHICAFVRIADNAERTLEQNDCNILANWGNIYIADIPVDRLSSLSQCSNVERIEASSPCSVTIDTTAVLLSTDKAWKGTNLKQKYDGTGVVIGVQDIGFDLTHPTFYSADMKNYRIKRLWDMLSPDTLQSNLFVGRDYTTKDELISIKHSYDGFIEAHGTHTSSTAAGSGAEGNGKASPYVGMAPGAELCFVANATGDNSSLVDSIQRYKFTTATDALGFKYIFDYAKSVGKPCVISFSEGSRDSFYGDEMLYGEVIDSLIGPGKIMLSSAGNEGYNKSYIYKSPDKERAGTFLYNEKSYYTLSLARSNDANLAFRLKFYNKQLKEPLTFTIPSRKVFEAEEGALLDTAYVSEKDTYLISVSAYPNCYNNEQDAYEIFVQNLNCGTALSSDGTSISLEMLGEGVTAEMFRYTGYFVDNAIDKELSGALCKYNVNVPSCFPSVICVGATIYRTGVTNYLGTWKQAEKGSDGARSNMSSVGPSLSEIIKPDVMAPGCNIIAAYNSYYLENNPEAGDISWSVRNFEYNGRTYPWTANSGTSMACPVAAGIVALWLQAMPTLTTEQVLEIIAATSNQYDHSLTYPNNYYGHGEIDAYAGLKYIEDKLIPLSLSTIKAENDGNIYNLQGQKVDQNYKGIIIINGKKYAQGFGSHSRL